jgi:hypothetical protein
VASTPSIYNSYSAQSREYDSQILAQALLSDIIQFCLSQGREFGSTTCTDGGSARSTPGVHFRVAGQDRTPERHSVHGICGSDHRTSWKSASRTVRICYVRKHGIAAIALKHSTSALALQRLTYERNARYLYSRPSPKPNTCTSCRSCLPTSLYRHHMVPWPRPAACCDAAS